MKLKIQRITTNDHEAWDRLIHTSPQGCALLSSDCLSIWQETEPDLHLLRIGCFNEEHELVGGQAFFFRYAAFGLRVAPFDLDITYSNSPILAKNISEGSPEYFEILRLLTDKANLLFLQMSIYCHPSIQDIRPLLQRGWIAEPAYTHIWDVRERDSLLKYLRTKKRFHNENRIRDRLDFAEETGAKTLDEFVALYQKSAGRTGVYLSNTWDTALRKRMEWMLHKDVIRFFTCRKKTGELLSMATYVLNRPQKTANGWLMANDFSQGEKEFVPISYLLAIENLSSEISFIDIAEGVHPALYTFKDSLGTTSIPYYRVYRPRRLLLEKIKRILKAIRSFGMRMAKEDE